MSRISATRSSALRTAAPRPGPYRTPPGTWSGAGPDPAGPVPTGSPPAGGTYRASTDQPDGADGADGADGREYPQSRFRVRPEQRLTAWPEYLVPGPGEQRPAARGTSVAGPRMVAQLGPWLVGVGGEPTAGALGVLVEDALGLTLHRAHRACPPGSHAVTAELSLEIVTRPPWSGPHLVADARLLGRDERGAMAVCEVRDSAGRLAAVAAGRFHWVPVATDPASAPANGRFPADGAGPVPVTGPAYDPAVALPPAPHGSLLETLGLAAAGPTRHGELGRLILPGHSVFDTIAGTVHGGVLLCLSDLVTDALAPPDEPERTTGIRIHYLRPAGLGAPVTSTAETIHRTRTSTLYRVTTAGPSDRPYTIATISRERARGMTI
ncbi:PaaI family thioesterase [Frankia sp. AiPa1]|uniref:PaaI family thioesterase n=1 Tax=Frankia sp. AiPa1 TaxID=573492 RepID=UPI00202B9BCC|nr:PaaI family thioesterase [Frankia sp. AiPa1]MCL9762628.1 PaaI family thioesterase [Frankia sp. AiPa1]